MSELGKICQHFQLARSCELCEKDAEIARLRAELDAKDDYIGCVLGELRQRNAELESAREAIGC